MIAREYFPLGKAYNEAFCNRVEETRWLVSNILSGKHSLLIAPRRYGKSSLAERGLEEAKLKNVKVNFHLCTSEEEVAELITKSVAKLIGETIGPVDKIVTSIKRFLTHLQPKISLVGDIATLELGMQKETNIAVAITESLLLIENLLKEKSQKAVLFFDEFQEISKLKNCASIEGAIRTAAQEMQHLSIIFSGSIRSLLADMFEDEKRPLYKLCRKHKLTRISAEHYQNHLNVIAKKTWGKQLSKAVVEAIIGLTNRHPYYMNYLCDSLWTMSDDLPQVQDVEAAWDRVIEEEWGDAIRELGGLPANQRRILKYISKFPGEKLQSQYVTEALNMPSSTVASNIQVLVEKDYIEVANRGQYEIISPMLKAVTNYEQVI